MRHEIRWAAASAEGEPLWSHDARPRRAFREAETYLVTSDMQADEGWTPDKLEGLSVSADGKVVVAHTHFDPSTPGGDSKDRSYRWRKAAGAESCLFL